MLESALASVGLKKEPPLTAVSPWVVFTDELRARGLPVPRASWRVRMNVQTIYGIATDEGIATAVRSGLTKAVWSADLRIQPPDHDDSIYSHLETTDESLFDGPSNTAERELKARLAASVVVLANQVELRLKVTALSKLELIEALAAPTPELRLAAVERLSMFRDDRSASALGQRLEAESMHSIRLRIIGALAEIGSPVVVDTLIGIANPRERETLRAVLDALSAIGGHKVLAFLNVLSSHDAADIREMVDTARSRVRRAQRQTGETAPSTLRTPREHGNK